MTCSDRTSVEKYLFMALASKDVILGSKQFMKSVFEHTAINNCTIGAMRTVYSTRKIRVELTETRFWLRILRNLKIRPYTGSGVF